MPGRVSTPTTSSTDAQVLDTIDAVLALRERQEGDLGRHQRLVERLTQSLGRPRTVYVTLLTVAAWVAYNLVAYARAWPIPDPPPFNWLQGVVGIAALLMTTMVLTTQNRQAHHAEQRAHLDLQVNLLAEQKIAKIVGLLEELRRDMPNVRDRSDPTAEAMAHAVDPHVVMAAIEKLDVPGDPTGTRRDDAPPSPRSEAASASPETTRERPAGGKRVSG